MDWSEIKDPKGEIEIRASFRGKISGYYTPEEIQKKINDHGVVGMVRTVNEFLRSHKIGAGLMLTHDKEHRKILIDYTYSEEWQL